MTLIDRSPQTGEDKLTGRTVVEEVRCETFQVQRGQGTGRQAPLGLRKTTRLACKWPCWQCRRQPFVIIWSLSSHLILIWNQCDCSPRTLPENTLIYRSPIDRQSRTVSPCACHSFSLTQFFTCNNFSPRNDIRSPSASINLEWFERWSFIRYLNPFQYHMNKKTIKADTTARGMGLPCQYGVFHLRIWFIHSSPFEYHRYLSTCGKTADLASIV